MDMRSLAAPSTRQSNQLIMAGNDSSLSELERVSTISLSLYAEPTLTKIKTFFLPEIDSLDCCFSCDFWSVWGSLSSSGRLLMGFRFERLEEFVKITERKSFDIPRFLIKKLTVVLERRTSGRFLIRSPGQSLIVGPFKIFFVILHFLFLVFWEFSSSS